MFGRSLKIWLKFWKDILFPIHKSNIPQAHSSGDCALRRWALAWCSDVRRPAESQLPEYRRSRSFSSQSPGGAAKPSPRGGGVAARGSTWPGPRVWAPGSRDGPGSGCLGSGGWGWLGLPAEAGAGGLVGCCTEVGTRAGVGTQAVSPRADGLGLAAGGRLLLDPSRLPLGSADAPGLAPTGLGCKS